MKRGLKLAILAPAMLLAYGCTVSSGTPADYANMIIANNEQAEYVETTYNQYQHRNEWTKDEYTDVQYLGYGLVKLIKNDDSVSFYSLSYQRNLFEWDGMDMDTTYEIKPSIVGFYMKVINGEDTRYYDSLGNCLASIEVQSSGVYDLSIYGLTIGAYEETPSITTVSGEEGFTFNEVESNGSSETYIVCRSNDTEYHYGMYRKDSGSITTLSTNPLIGIVDGNYKVGDTYVDGGYTDLSQYGMPSGYYLYRTTNDFYAVMKDGVLVTSFNLPHYDAMAIFDGKILYQYSTLLPEDAASYSYFTTSDSGETNKYALTSVSLDLTSGSSLEIVLDFVIDRIQPFRNANRIYTYGSAQIRSIQGSGALSSLSETYIITSSGYLYYNATNKNAADIIKLDDTHYYDTVNKILYDSNLNVISFFSGVSNVSVDRSGNFLSGAINGYYGVMDYSRKILVPFEYETQFTKYEDGFILGRKDGRYYKISLADASAEEIGSFELNTLAEGCYYYSVTDADGNPSEYRFLTSSKSLATVSASSIVTSSPCSVSCSVNDSAYAFAFLGGPIEEGSTNSWIAYTFYSKGFPGDENNAAETGGNSVSSSAAILPMEDRSKKDF